MKTGRVQWVRFVSEVLEGNAAGDPHARRVPAYLPPSYDERPERRYPVAFVLTGFTGRGPMLLNDNLWNPPLDARMDALIAAGCGEMILVMPDCATRYGGSQYLDSSATGRYQTHLIAELVPFVDRSFRTLAGREHRGVLGKPSGGYGALVQGMRHPEVFGAVACHSGDMYFEYCYRGDVPKFCARVQNAGGLARWFADFEAAAQKKPEDLVALNILGMAAAYSPDPAATPFGIELPCDLETGAFRPEVWERWLALDPIVMLDRHADALRWLALLHLDCGIRDEWHLHLGMRMLARRLKALGIRHEVEEFDDGHMNIQYRYDVSLPKLARALGAPR
ncbi:MAG: esterase [Candidatus Eisenbacteria bacterium]|uniref:Esterase n=1 Tax=Eiseniibacteriota bacterium TaxID=2212470 RepID=A0A538UEA4_UNCEI|nr:MAG: esterase [Candidatus Eisenbacteria bacterium]